MTIVPIIPVALCGNAEVPHLSRGREGDREPLTGDWAMPPGRDSSYAVTVHA